MVIWSFALAAAGLAGLVLAGGHNKIGWLVGLSTQVLWIAYAIVTRQWGFIFTAAAYGYVYARNWFRWRSEERKVDERSGGTRQATN